MAMVHLPLHMFMLLKSLCTAEREALLEKIWTSRQTRKTRFYKPDLQCLTLPGPELKLGIREKSMSQIWKFQRGEVVVKKP